MTAHIPPLNQISVLSTIHTVVPHGMDRDSSSNAFKIFVSSLYENFKRNLKTIAPILLQDSQSYIDVPDELPQALSTWVTLGVDLIAKKVFSLIPKFYDELSQKGEQALQLKTRREAPLASSSVIEYWNKNSQTFLRDVIGTLILGSNLGTVLLNQLEKTKNAKTDQAICDSIYLRLRMSTKALEFFNSASSEISEWRQVLDQCAIQVLSPKDDSIELMTERGPIKRNLKKVVEIFEFAIFHIINSDNYTLQGKSLKDLFSIQSQTSPFEHCVEMELQRHQPIPQSPEVNALHILSGTIHASLKEPSRVNDFFGEMLDALEYRSHVMIPEVTLLDEEKTNLNLFQFLKESAKERKIVEMAEEVILHPEKAPETVANMTFLDLRGCQLSSLPDNFDLFSNLHTLELSTNRFTTIPKPVLSLKLLKVLHLNGNQITSIPKDILKMPLLNRLDILENPIREVPVALKKVIWELPFQASWVKD